MKALYLHFYDFSPHSGICKKIIAQIDALKKCGADISLCYMKIDENGNQLRMCNEEVLDNYGNGFRAKIVKWFYFSSITEYILKNKIEFLYIRSFYNTNPSLLRLLKKVRKAGVKVVMEIPTYPYDTEVKKSPLKHRFIFLINKLFRGQLRNHLDAIVTFSDFEKIHGVNTIRISNGIDFSTIKVKSTKRELSERFNLIGVADVRFWHGFDRVIEGLANYYNTPQNLQVHFDIVGEGVESDINALKHLVLQKNLQKFVHFHGNKSGEELDLLFEQAHFGIASLGRHRSGITKIKTLKTREYAARGIAFIYSESDDDFDSQPYIIKAPANESPVNIQEIIDFYNRLILTPLQIRESISDTLSWDVQMKKVIDHTFKSL